MLSFTRAFESNILIWLNNYRFTPVIFKKKLFYSTFLIISNDSPVNKIRRTSWFTTKSFGNSWITE